MNAVIEHELKIFQAALDLQSSKEREVFLEQACAGNVTLRANIAKLFSAHAKAASFFAGAADLMQEGGTVGANGLKNASDIVEEKSGTRIGHFKIVEKIGEGGCGVVYLAEQLEPIRRRVALKILKLGMDTKAVITRFEQERQALALMNHPKIASVLDGGATESGRPYFVMELVEGVTITDYCNQNNLDVSQRLKLFVEVCQAIQHAHQKGIIHRDIKPSNVLVTLHDGVPMPKVIDFGIAKATEGRLNDNTVFTAYGQFIGTPAYMSPEQAGSDGLDVDTRSDIYSLGVLLYELLTGQTPFNSKELARRGVDELRRTLREQEPPPPSALLTNLGDTKLSVIAAQHNAEPPRLLSTLRGDLDWIVMKALEKDRSRRYETANGLAMDVQRYLNNEPVVARPPSRIYKFQKLVRRNLIVFAAIGAVTLTLLMGLSLSTWWYLQERAARRDAVAAEQQQIRLREEADRLRQQAEFHQKLSEAIVALSRSKSEEADRLVADIPAPEPNLEYADLYRTLGDWHASSGQWKRAAERYAVLVQVNQPDDWDETTLDDLRYAPLLLETGDTVGYEQFCRSAIAHFAGTANPVAAERVIKMSLLTPAAPELLAALTPLAMVASNSLAVAHFDPSRDAWRTFSLALLEYRRGNYAGVEQWRQKCLAYPDQNPVREMTFQIVLATTHYQNGQHAQARAELESPEQKIETHFRRRPVDAADGYWFDWVFANILLQEANSLIESNR